MTATNQNFTLYDGDAGDPQIGPILDGDGNVYDLSVLSDIVWVAYTDPALTATMKKKLSNGAGEVSFVTNGTDGLFQVHLVGTDTSGKSGAYFHNATLVGQDGQDSTVETGLFWIVPRGSVT